MEPSFSNDGNKVHSVIILGCGPTHVECDFAHETWGVNGTYTFAKRLDKLFMTDEEAEVDNCWYDVVKLVKADTALVLPGSYKKFTDLGLNVEVFPINEILQRFKTRFFSNSIAYMMAYALLKTKTVQSLDDPVPKVVEGYDKIFFYGIDMMTNSTYIQEKGGVEYWMGIAKGMGVEVINTRGSATGKTWNGKMYGAYGKWEEEELSEGLYAPWQFIRVGKAQPRAEGVEEPGVSVEPQDEWIQDPTTNEYTRVPVVRKVAGN